MGAPKGNTYAQKEENERENVLHTLESCIELMNTPPYYSTLSHALKDNKINRRKLAYWREKYSQDSLVLNTIKDLQSEAESNNEIGTAEGEIPVAWGAFNAKCNFGWIEKGVQAMAEATTQLIKVHSVAPDGTKKRIDG